MRDKQESYTGNSDTSVPFDFPKFGLKHLSALNVFHILIGLDDEMFNKFWGISESILCQVLPKLYGTENPIFGRKFTLFLR